VILRKGNKKLTNVIFLAHEAGHFLDLRDNPKGQGQIGAMHGLVFKHPEDLDHPQGLEALTSAEQYAREKEAWRKGYRILSGHPCFTPPIKRKFWHWRKKSLRGYAEKYRKGYQRLREGKRPLNQVEIEQIVKEHEKKQLIKKKQQLVKNLARKIASERKKLQHKPTPKKLQAPSATKKVAVKRQG
jgi:hypothetical protein